MNKRIEKGIGNNIRKIRESKKIYVGDHMINTTLCYIKFEGKVMMLHRTKKKSDPNEGKWIGIGGKLEEDESPEEGALREIYEETGIVPQSLEYRGIVTFVSDCCEGEYMHLFTGTADSESVTDCDEGELKWIEEGSIHTLNLWEGDRIFLELILGDERFFSLKLSYKGDKLSTAVLNGRNLSITD